MTSYGFKLIERGDKLTYQCFLFVEVDPVTHPMNNELGSMRNLEDFYLYYEPSSSLLL
jgi:hypothetical protein